MTQRLIVPVDGSDSSWAAVDVAVSLGRRIAAVVLVVEVVFDPADVADAEGHSGDVRWNFEKFLIAPDGAITRFGPMILPDDPALVAAIEASL